MRIEPNLARGFSGPPSPAPGFHYTDVQESFEVICQRCAEVQLVAMLVGKGDGLCMKKQS